MACSTTTGIDGGLPFSCNTNTIKPPMIAKVRKKAAALFNLIEESAAICRTSAMKPNIASAACVSPRAGKRLR